MKAIFSILQAFVKLGRLWARLQYAKFVARTDEIHTRTHFIRACTTYFIRAVLQIKRSVNGIYIQWILWIEFALLWF